jgi:hypothetical protein
MERMRYPHPPRTDLRITRIRHSRRRGRTPPARATTASSSSTPATPTATATPRTSAYGHAAQQPAEPADASTPINFDDPAKARMGGHALSVGQVLLADHQRGPLRTRPDITRSAPGRQLTVLQGPGRSRGGAVGALR